MTTTKRIEIPRPTNQSKLHLYVAWGCPFCHRVLAALALTGLDKRLTYTWMHNIKRPEGWEIDSGEEPLFGKMTLHDVYERLAPGVKHSRSVPLLVELTSRTLLSTTSAQITRFISRGMNGKHSVDRNLSPVDLEGKIDWMNSWLHENVNRAVYLVGFANTQAQYEAKVMALFQSLDKIEARLAVQPYLLGNAITESDIYLLATLIRFDNVYYPLFKCCFRRIVDYPALSLYLERLRAIDGIDTTFNHQLIKEHYYLSAMHVSGEVRVLNPSRLIPVDPWSSLQRLNACKLKADSIVQAIKPGQSLTSTRKKIKHDSQSVGYGASEP